MSIIFSTSPSFMYFLNDFIDPHRKIQDKTDKSAAAIFFRCWGNQV